MTLLSEYQALPGEPDHAEYAAHWRASLGGDFPDVVVADITRDKLERRDAVIRLLCRALRDDYCRLVDRSDVEWARDRSALLTAVERDFPEGA